VACELVREAAEATREELWAVLSGIREMMSKIVRMELANRVTDMLKLWAFLMALEIWNGKWEKSSRRG
jgi:hypothetical protein